MARTATAEITAEEISRAGRVLFGPAFRADARGWQGVLRAAYRRRALETHPDRARALGRVEADLAREFRAVADAYALLSSVPAERLPRVPRPPAPRPPPRAAPRPPAPRAPAPRRAVELPDRPVRLAEYLCYTGRAPWSALPAALAWQRARRPPLGRIAVDLGFLSPGELSELLSRRRAARADDVPLGEFAVRLGYLSAYERLVIVGRQLRHGARIGAWFVANGLVDEAELDELRRRVLRHNARHAR